MLIYMFSQALDLYYVYSVPSNKKIYLDTNGNITTCPTHVILWDALNESEVPQHIKDVVEDVLS
jgi:hypothetical protein